MSFLPAPKPMTGPNVVQPAIDWQSFSKTLVLEGAFVGTMIAVLTGHGTPDVVSLAWALGGTLGVLRITDIMANAFNVKTYLNNPQAQAAGLMPQANNTPLVSTKENGSNASITSP